MHVIIGGAYNGKSKYVSTQLLQDDQTIEWVEGTLPEKGSTPIVINRLHDWLTTFEGTEQEAIDMVLPRLQNRECIVILTDIGRGIVPMDAKTRAFRDACGRLYQAIITEAQQVTQIWYGIPKKIK